MSEQINPDGPAGSPDNGGGPVKEGKQSPSYGRRALVLGAAAAGVGAAASIAAPGVAQATVGSEFPAIESVLAKANITSAILQHIADTEITSSNNISISVKFQLKWAPGQPLTNLTQPAISFLVAGQPVSGG